VGRTAEPPRAIERRWPRVELGIKDRGARSDSSQMPFLHYTEHDVRRLFSRTIRIRWPEEGLLFVTGCRAERMLGPHDVPSESERGGARYYDRRPGDRHGYLAATRSRLIYQDRITLGSVIMALAASLGAIAVAVLLFGHNLMGWLVMSAVALGVWMLGRIVEVGTAGTMNVEFDNIVRFEAGTQRMVAVGQRQTVLSLHIGDPSDFRMVASLVSGLGNAAA
jgi:hypothetical protein